jgi:hypothetical protein
LRADYQLRLRTEFEENTDIPSTAYIVLEKDFSKMHPDAEGTARVFFFLNAAGKVDVANDWGRWDRTTEMPRRDDRFKIVRNVDGKAVKDCFFTRGVLAQDGIMLGEHDSKRHHLHFPGTRYPAPTFWYPGSYFINLRRAAKLPLKPNRAPYQGHLYAQGKEEQIWLDFERRVHEFISSILLDILVDPTLAPRAEALWSIISMYHLSLYGISKDQAFLHLPLPISGSNAESGLVWCTLASLLEKGITTLVAGQSSANLGHAEKVAFVRTETLGLPLADERMISAYVHTIMRATTVLRLVENQVFYDIKPFDVSFKTLADGHVSHPVGRWEYFQAYEPQLEAFALVTNPLGSANLLHHGVRFVYENREVADDANRRIRWMLCNLMEAFSAEGDFPEKPSSEWSRETLRAVKLAIRHWEKAPWEGVPASAQPPYRIRSTTTGRSYEVSLDFLRGLTRDASVAKDDSDDELADLD